MVTIGVPGVRVDGRCGWRCRVGISVPVLLWLICYSGGVVAEFFRAGDGWGRGCVVVLPVRGGPTVIPLGST